jgi:two-component system OmpR family response regulator
MSSGEITILVVDDEKDFCYFVKRNLERAGYRVITITEARRAVSAARRYRPDLILLDIMMPEMNGFEVLKKIKEDKKTFSFPVIMLTGIDDDTAKQKASALYNEDYIVKPVLIEDLRARLQQVLAARGLDNPRKEV